MNVNTTLVTLNLKCQQQQHTTKQCRSENNSNNTDTEIGESVRELSEALMVNMALTKLIMS